MVTVHNIQRQTLDKIFFDLRPPFFSPDQLYFALYRVRDAQDVLLLRKEDDCLQESDTFHQIAVVMINRTLPEAVQLGEENYNPSISYLCCSFNFPLF